MNKMNKTLFSFCLMLSLCCVISTFMYNHYFHKSIDLQNQLDVNANLIEEMNENTDYLRRVIERNSEDMLDKLDENALEDANRLITIQNDLQARISKNGDKLMKLERYKMYDKEIFYNKTVNGVYHFDWGYCVWDDYRLEHEIIRTDYHETCHQLINYDYAHFCDPAYS